MEPTSNKTDKEKVYYQSHISFAPAYAGGVMLASLSYFLSQNSLVPFALTGLLYFFCKTDKVFCFLLANSKQQLSAALVFTALFTILAPAILNTFLHQPIVAFLTALLCPVGSIVTAVLLVKLYNEELLSKHGWEKSSW